MRTRVSISIDKGLLEWVDEQAKSREFRNRSHVFEMAIEKYKELREKKAE